jgi:MoxR-like ATPase
VNVSEVGQLAQRIRAEVGKAVVGQAETVDLMLTALFAGGHMMLEGPPGVAKTFLAQSFARAIGLDFGRIQFTPDLMPGDIIGANLFNFQTSTFTLTRGPIFCELLLADEINRTPPKTQAALLEAMQERQVTIDGESQPLPAHFMVVATMNPIEQQGTYPLPEAQLDRFLFKQVLTYPSLSEERTIVATHGQRIGHPDPAQLGVEQVTEAQTIGEAIDAVAGIRLTEEIVAYVVDLVRATRATPDLESGVSPRGAAMLATGARARAAIEGRDYVIPDDVKTLAAPLLIHRLIVSADAAMSGRSSEAILAELLNEVPVPVRGKA